jgi:hypothetical protein
MAYKSGPINDSAVSEAIGFILIFGIMLSGIGLITLYGYPMLLQEQHNTNIRNMERNMILLQSDVNALVYKSVPYKETTMQVSGGVLSVKSPDPASSFIIINEPSNQPFLDPTLFPSGEFPPGELHFLSDSGDINLGLENGAVVKKQGGGSVMLSEPRWFIDTDPGSGNKTFVITLTQVDTSRSSLAKTGLSTVQMSIEPLNISAGRDLINGNDDDTNIIDTETRYSDVAISITVNSPDYLTAWKNYFENTLGMTTADGIIWTKTGVDRIVIKAWRINVINL